MRIVQVITRTQRRGAEIFAIQLAEELTRLGHELTLISLFKSEQNLVFNGEFIQLNLPDRGKIDWRGFKELSRVIRTINPEIIQANASETLRMCVGARFFFKGNYKLIYRNANQMSVLLKSKLHQIWNQVLLSQVDAIVSVSEASKIDLMKTFNFQRPIRVIPIGIVPEEINKKLLQFTPALPKPYIIQIGGLVPEKDPLGMLELFKELSIPNLHLIFLGSGPLEEELKEKINEMKLGGLVIHLPNQTNIFPYLSKALALVMPSKVEGLPGVILEAMYCKVPVVAYGIGGIPEVIQNEKTGWLIPPANSANFKDSLRQILEIVSPKSDPRILNSYRLVVSDFLLPQIALRFQAFYREIFSA